MGYCEGRLKVPRNLWAESQAMAAMARGGRLGWACVALLVASVVALVGCDELPMNIPQQFQLPPPPPPQQQVPPTVQPTQPPVVPPPVVPPPQPAVVQPPQPPVVIQPPIVAPPEEQPEGGPAWVDTLAFDPNQVAVQVVNGRWFLATGEVVLASFEGDEAGARRALDVIRFYRMNQQCSLGRPTPLLQWYLVNGQAPSGPMPGEVSLPLDVARLDVAQVDDRWLVMQGNVWLFDFGQAEAEARALVAILRNGGFTHVCYVGQPQPRMVYFRAGGAGQYLPFVQARLVADTPCYSGPLPAAIGFRGSIAVGQPCDVQYTFVAHDGSMQPVRALRFEQAGVAEVTTELGVAQEGSGWLVLRVLSPALTQSAPAYYEVRPEARPLVQAGLIAQPYVYTGRLPATIRFRGWIAVGQPCDVQFAFVRSNGAVGPLQTIRFTRRGRREVFDDWTLFRDYVGWAAIQVFSPVELVSAGAPFEVRSGGHNRISVSLTADPTLYSGPLPATVDFRGMIAVGQPCEVQYLFVRSDGQMSPMQRLRFDRPGFREVSTRWSVNWEGTGWQVLRVVWPAQVESEQATFEVRSAAQPRVHAWLDAEPDVHPGPLPATVRFRGRISAGQRCDVSYVFVRSTGEMSPVHTLRFFRPGTREVVDDWTLPHDYTGWELIRILAPVQLESRRADFTVKAKHPPVKVDVALAAFPPRYVGPAPALVQLRGSISVSRPCDVRYSFLRSDGPATPPRLLHFAGPGAQQVELPLRFTQDYTGWALLRVLAPIVVDSAQVPVVVDIREGPPLVVHATLRAEPPAYKGPGPATIAFRGTIRANQPCEVRYQFVRSDGTHSAPALLRFDKAGIQAVEEARQFTADARGWEMIRVLAPVAVESERADFDVNIIGAPAIAASLRAVPPRYEGPPPGTIEFKGVIQSNQAGDVRYQFVYSTGLPSMPQTIRFDRPGKKDVGDIRQFKSDFKGWALLRILAPVAVESPREQFEVNITVAPAITASLRAVPPRYEGPAPGTIEFKGIIQSNQAGEVRYQLVFNSGPPSPPQTIQFDRPGRKDVGDVRRFAADAKGWAMLRILAPVAAESERADFEVNIAQALAIQAALRADPPKYAGPPPATISFKGTIRANQPCEVRYTIVRSDGLLVPPRTLRFTHPGEQGVDYELKTVRAGRGWAMLRVLAPVAAASEQAAFEVDFEAAKPPTISVELTADPPTYTGPGPAIIRLKGVIRVDQACSVQYVLTRSDGGAGPPRVLRFDGPGQKDVEPPPLRFTTDHKGWIQLRVLAPVAAESARVPLSVDIRDAGKGKAKDEEEAVNVTATLTVAPAKYIGKLPVLIRFAGMIRVTGPCEVKYCFARSDGTTTPERSARFTTAGARPVVDTWQVNQELSGWAVLRVTAPVKTESAQAAFEVKRLGK